MITAMWTRKFRGVLAVLAVSALLLPGIIGVVSADAGADPGLFQAGGYDSGEVAGGEDTGEVPAGLPDTGSGGLGDPSTGSSLVLIGLGIAVAVGTAGWMLSGLARRSRTTH